MFKPIAMPIFSDEKEEEIIQKNNTQNEDLYGKPLSQYQHEELKNKFLKTKIRN